MPAIYKRSKRRGAKYYFRYTDERGNRRQEVGFSDKGETDRLLRKRLDEVHKRQKSTADPAEGAYAEEGKRPVGELVDEFRVFMESEGTSEKQIKRKVGAILDAAEACDWRTAWDIDATSVSRHRVELLRTLATQSVNLRIRAITGFTRWMVTDRRRGMDPLVGIKFGRTDADRRLVRRALNADEVERLCEAAERVGDSVTVPKRYRSKGTLRTGTQTREIPNRALLYRVAFGTGFRLAELKSLTPADFDLDASPPMVTVSAGYSKRRRQDEQPIHRHLAVTLRPFLRSCPPREQVWGGLPESMAQVMAVDMAEAGIPVEDDRGRVADFHSLRMSYITNLGLAGVPLVVAQSLARHSTPVLTSNIYSDVSKADKARYLEQAALPAS